MSVYQPGCINYNTWEKYCDHKQQEASITHQYPIYDVPTQAICLQTQHIKLRAQIRTYGVGNLIALPNFHDQKLTFDHPVEIQKETALEEG